MPDRRNDSAMSLEVVALNEDDRRTCPAQGRVAAARGEPSVEPAPSPRCAHAQRELYRTRFPVEP